MEDYYEPNTCYEFEKIYVCGQLNSRYIHSQLESVCIVVTLTAPLPTINHVLVFHQVYQSHINKVWAYLLVEAFFLTKITSMFTSFWTISDEICSICT